MASYIQTGQENSRKGKGNEVLAKVNRGSRVSLKDITKKNDNREVNFTGKVEHLRNDVNYLLNEGGKVPDNKCYVRWDGPPIFEIVRRLQDLERRLQELESEALRSRSKFRELRINRFEWCTSFTYDLKLFIYCSLLRNDDTNCRCNSPSRARTSSKLTTMGERSYLW